MTNTLLKKAGDIALEAFHLAVARRSGMADAENYNIERINPFTHVTPYSTYARVWGSYTLNGKKENLKLFVKYIGPRPQEKLPTGYLSDPDPRREELVYSILGGIDGIPRLEASKVNGTTGYIVLEDVGERTLEKLLEEYGKKERKILLIEAASEIRDFQSNSTMAIMNAAISGRITSRDIQRIVKPGRSMGERLINYLSNLKYLGKESDKELACFARAYEHLFEGIDPSSDEQKRKADELGSLSPIITINHGDYRAENILLGDDNKLKVIDPKLKVVNALHDVACLVSSPSVNLSYDDWMQIAEVASLAHGVVEIRSPGEEQKSERRIFRIDNPLTEVELSDHSKSRMRETLPILTFHYSLRNIAKKAALKQMLPERVEYLEGESKSFRNLIPEMRKNLEVSLVHIFENLHGEEKKNAELVKGAVLKAVEGHH